MLVLDLAFVLELDEVLGWLVLVLDLAFELELEVVLGWLVELVVLVWLVDDTTFLEDKVPPTGAGAIVDEVVMAAPSNDELLY